MHRPKPDKLHDELDALLDGRPVELTDELAPLVEAADSLRAELASYQLDPGVADRHLERVLEGSGTVVRLPVRQPAGAWDVRRRVVAVALAAALVLAPATIASAAALPGQAMYPFKLAIEQLRIASVQWSPTREAGERTRVADQRLDELERLVELQMFNQVGPAVTALAEAVRAAENAVEEAEEEGAAGSEVAALAGKLGSVRSQARRAVVVLASTIQAKLPTVSDSTRDAIEAAVEDAQQEVLPPPGREAVPTAGTPTPTTADPPVIQPPPPTSPPNTAPTPPPPPPSTAPPTTTPPPTTASTNPPTTAEPPTSATPESPGGQPDNAGQTGAEGRDSVDDASPTTVTAP
jgi:Domain of unknown function (DUF5667)